MKRLLVCFVTVFSLVCAVPVHAALFDGRQVRLTYEFPSLGTIYDTRIFTVGAGVEASLFPTGSPQTNIDFSDFNIFVTYLSALKWTETSFNGFHVFDMNGTIPAFTSVTINPATNMSGLDASRITFDADNIYVNWNDLSFSLYPATIVSLDINSQTVPEPSAMLLLGSGLIGLVGLRRRLKK